MNISKIGSKDSVAAAQKYINSALSISVEGLAGCSVNGAKRVSSRMATDDSLEIFQQLPKAELSRIGLRYCHSDEPACDECPMQNFCVFGRRSLTSKDSGGIPFIDLFSGAGGLSLGLEISGFRPACAVDIDPSSLETYSFNRPFLSHDSVICSSIEDSSVLQGLPKAPIVVVTGLRVSLRAGVRPVLGWCLCWG